MLKKSENTPLRAFAGFGKIYGSFFICSGGEIGRHACLRCMWRDPCGFESRPEHQFLNKAAFAVFFVGGDL